MKYDMKRILLFSLSIVGLLGCKGNADHKKTTGEMRPLHFTGAGPGNIEPIALLNYGGFYRLIYGTSDAANNIRQSISKDLINWSERSKSVFPGYNNSVLRGGVIIDSNNITGYGTKERPALVAVLVSIENEDSSDQDKKKVLPVLAFSRDDGNSWAVATDTVNFPRAFINNPQHVSICRHQATKKWIMSVALNDHVEFYSSADLRFWTFESLLGTDFFPEEIKWKRTALFPSGDDHWVLLADVKKTGKSQAGGGTVYFVGYFDGHSFINQSSQLHWLDYGEDIYGSLSAVAEDGRTINVGWKTYDGEPSSKTGDHDRELMTIPRELHLENINREWFITSSPVRELKSIYSKEVKLAPVNVSYKANDVLLVSNVDTPVEVFLKFNTSNIQKGSFPTRFGVSFWNDKEKLISFGFDRFGYYYIDKSGLTPSSGTLTMNAPVKMPFEHVDSTMSFRFIVDISTIECFTEEGKLVMTSTYTSDEPLNKLKLFSVNGNIDLLEARVVELKTPRP
jgi:fructan beta-fructosidase